MTNILIITYYWPPAGGAGVQRVLKFVKYLPDFQYRPIILTVSNGDYPALDFSLEEDIPKECVVIKMSIREPHNLYKKVKGMSQEEKISTTILTDKKSGMFDRVTKWIRLNLFLPDARLGWLFSNFREVLEELRKYDIRFIFSSGPPHTVHLVAKKISKKLKEPYIVDFRDSWTEFVSYQENKRFFLSKWIDTFLERKAMNMAEHVVLVSEQMKRDYTSIISPQKISIITNGFDADDFPRKPKISKDFLWVYTGNLDKNRVPYVFLKSVQTFIEKYPNQKIGLCFIGKICEECRKEVKRLELEKQTSFLPYMPHNKVTQKQVEAFGLFFVVDKTPKNKGFLAGKIFEYIGASRPIIGIGPKDSDAAIILEKSESGQMFEYDDMHGILAYLEKMYGFFLKKELFINQKEDYTRKQKTKELSELFNELEKNKMD